MDKKKIDLWKYITYKMLSLNSSFVFPLEFFFSKEIDINKYKFSKYLSVKNKGLYIHIPFCVKICDYCGCYKLKMTNDYDLDKYVSYIIKELEIFYKLNGNIKINFSTIMFGGGTASVLNSNNLDKLLSGLFKYIDNFGLEQISFESSPFTLTFDKIDILKKHSVHRVSIGVQSFDKEVIEKNNRIYVSYEKIKGLIDYCHSNNILVQIDLMVGIKLQNEDNCIEDYKKLMELGVDSYTLNYYIPHSYANFSDTQKSLELKEKIRKLDKKYNFISKTKDSYLLQEEYVFNDFNYFVIGLGLGATSNIGNELIYRKTDINNYYSMIDNGNIPYDEGITMDYKFPYIKYIFEKYKDGEIVLKDFFDNFNINILDVFSKELDFLIKENIIILETDKIIFLKGKYKSRIYLNIFLDDLISKKDIKSPLLNKQFHLDLMGLIYE